MVKSGTYACSMFSPSSLEIVSSTRLSAASEKPGEKAVVLAVQMGRGLSSRVLLTRAPSSLLLSLMISQPSTVNS